MKDQQETGFRERPHTADWALDVWAPTIEALLEQAARGMYALMDIQVAAEPRIQNMVQLDAPEPEVLLVSFLSELLYATEQDGVAFDRYDIRLDGLSLTARLEGAPLVSQAKEIKAVTYHNLAIRRQESSLSCTVVFDV